MADILKELNVEKLNICEPDGTVKMTLFNSQNIPSLIIGGEDILPGHRSNDGISGAMFYNNHGDECGGLIYGSNIDEDGKVSMGMSLTFDKWKQDQVLQLHLDKDGDQEKYGISIYDRPNEPITETLQMVQEFHQTTDRDRQVELVEKIQTNNQRRVFVGKDIDGETKIALFNSKGEEKIKLSIDENDNPVLELNNQKVPIKKLMRFL